MAGQRQSGWTMRWLVAVVAAVVGLLAWPGSVAVGATGTTVGPRLVATYDDAVDARPGPADGRHAQVVADFRSGSTGTTYSRSLNATNNHWWTAMEEGEASALAASRGGKTLEDTLRGVDTSSWNLEKWTDVSLDAAAKASGPQTLLIGATRPLRPDAVAMRELEVLIRNPSVPSITKVDLTSGIESVIHVK